ncbi:hypothetical protein BHE74_00017432 [Ensete ventricosum]|nr:hypothetical protein BHE74_00017432 [Ensete ventricosum]RZR98204.1 hypothetical protein BHM03_00027519 [Ensete ventricosum]
MLLFPGSPKWSVAHEKRIARAIVAQGRLLLPTRGDVSSPRTGRRYEATVKEVVELKLDNKTDVHEQVSDLLLNG